MAGKIKYKQLRKVIDDLGGYTGGKLDTKSMLAYAADEGWQPELAGKLLTADEVKALTVEMSEDQSQVLVSEGGQAPPPAQNGGGPPPPPAKSALPEDFDAKVKAGVESAMKGMGIEVVNGRPKIAGARIEVKSVAERTYEDRAKRGKTFFRDADTARGAQLYLQSMLYGSKHADFSNPEMRQKRWGEFQEWSKTKGYTTTGTPSIVPDAFLPDLIRNLDEQGFARRLARVIQMPNAEVTIPRRTGGLTGGYPNEGNTQSETTATYDNVSLRARTFVVNTSASKEIIQDSGLSFVDITFEEIMLAIKLKEDDAIINGDGTSTYGGMRGYLDLFGSTIGTTGQDVTGGDTALVHTETHISQLMGRLAPQFRQNAVFACNPEMSSVIFDRLGAAAGGTSARELEGWGYVQTYRNRPIIPINTMAGTYDASGDRIDVLYGDFSKSAFFGERSQMELNTDESVKFQSYAVALQGVVRHDINIYDIGDDTTAGAVVALWQT